MSYPVLWSFRRCPYAMRARLSLKLSAIEVELREILLRDKPDAFLQASSKATVPVLEADGRVIDESLDIMLWACKRSGDRHGWHHDYHHSPELQDFIRRLDGEFKTHLDRYKYATRYTESSEEADRLSRDSRQQGEIFIWELDKRLRQQRWLGGDRAGLMDIASLPFIRQFRIADQSWFDAQPWQEVTRWLSEFLESELFASVMKKYPPWQEGEITEIL